MAFLIFLAYKNVKSTNFSFNNDMMKPKEATNPQIAQFVRAKPTAPDPSAIPALEMNIPEPEIRAQMLDLKQRILPCF